MLVYISTLRFGSRSALHTELLASYQVRSIELDKEEVIPSVYRYSLDLKLNRLPPFPFQ